MRTTQAIIISDQCYKPSACDKCGNLVSYVELLTPVNGKSWLCRKCYELLYKIETGTEYIEIKEIKNAKKRFKKTKV